LRRQKHSLDALDESEGVQCEDTSHEPSAPIAETPPAYAEGGKPVLKPLDPDTIGTYYNAQTATIILEGFMLNKPCIEKIADYKPSTLSLIGCQFENKKDLGLFGALETVQSLFIADNTLDDASTYALGLLPNLRSLEFCNCSGIKKFANFPDLLENLENLTFRNMKLPKTGYPYLAALSLKAISFYNCTIADEGMSLFCKDSPFTDITLYNSNVTNATIQALAQKKTLRKVDLSNSSEISCISTLFQDSLQELILRNCPKIDDSSLKNITKAKNLHLLDISYTASSDTAAARIGELAQLTTLVAEKTGLTDRGVAQWSKLGALRSLNLADTKIRASKYLLQSLAKNHPQLNLLNLSGTPMTAWRLYLISKLPIQTLTLSRCPSLAEYGLAPLVNMVGLRQIELQGSIFDLQERAIIQTTLTRKLPGVAIYM
jgi:hypothetical protein